MSTASIPWGKGFLQALKQGIYPIPVHCLPRGILRWILFHGAGGSSAAEVQSQLYTALDQGYILQDTFDSTYQALDVVAKQLSSFITYLKASG